MAPVLSDLGDVAPDINRFLLELGPFSQAGIPAFESLGEAAQIGTPAVQNSVPVVRDLRTLADAARPVGKRLAEVLVSFRRNDGIERLMDYIFFQVAAVNGFDSFGHYLRAGLIVNQCSTYAVDPTGGCSANFRGAATATATAAGADSMPRDRVLAWTARALRGLDPREPPQEPRRGGGERKRESRLGRSGDGSGGDSGALRRSAAAPAAPPAPAAAAGGGGDPGIPLLDYLFGAEG
jgi:phospholipid/cholesterol/gamma-HCH transport system substrate-binding protein